MRELVLDTETTGLYHENGDRIVEIGIIELENHIKTGNFFHYYINPERKSDPKAEQVHGLSQDFLSNKPKFSDISEELVEFLADSRIIIHNALFDTGFLNSELIKCNLEELKEENILDTLNLARKKFPGQSVSLDALCRKFGIDISNRKIHGALKDAELLSLVYLELIGGKQISLSFLDTKIIENESKKDVYGNIDIMKYYEKKLFKDINNIDLNQIDYAKHKKFIKEIPNSIWDKIEN
jgi:DNA polymerase-3 subunit epsilon